MNRPPAGPLAIISDIHGNLDALTAVLADAAAQECSDIICLGDVVGYGPEPALCVRLIRQHCETVVMGNHENMALSLLQDDLADCEQGAGLWGSIALCQQELTGDDKQWMGLLPLSVRSGEMTFVHASLHLSARFDYIDCEEGARENFAAQESFISFHGHTHVPLIWEKMGRELVCHVPEADSSRLSPSRLYAVCVGSVGQPRDGDPRASYAIYEPAARRLTIRRVEYDIARALKRFRERGMTGFHSRRIAEGT